MFVCSRGRGGASLFPFGWSRFRDESILRGAEQVVRDRQKLSRGNAYHGAVPFTGEVLLARVLCFARPGRGSAVQRRREQHPAARPLRFPGTYRGGSQLAAAMERAPADEAAPDIETIQQVDPPVLDQ